MSGFVLSAIALLAVLLPGLLVQMSFNRAAARWAMAYTFDPGAVRSVLLAIPIALPFHALWGSAIHAATSLGGTATVQYSALLAILNGLVPPTGAVEINADLLWQLTLYVWTQAAAAIWIGRSLAAVAEQNGWDKSITLSSKAGHWHLLFRYPPDEPAGIILSVTVTMGGITYLYYGLLRDYEVGPDGTLVRVELEGAKRRPVGDGEEYEIPGEVLVVDCSDVRTFDIDYLYIVDEEELEDFGEAIDTSDSSLIDYVEVPDDADATPGWWTRPPYTSSSDRLR